jgi:Ca2+-binding RTX toxin-like protein
VLGGAGDNVLNASALTSAVVVFAGGDGADSFTGSSGANDTVDYSAKTAARGSP